MSDNINEAWNGLLSKLPQELHALIIPDLQAWDKGVQEKFQQIHSQYEDLKGYKALADNGYDPEYCKQTVSFAERLNQDPAGTISQVNSALNLGFVSKEDAEKLGQNSLGDNSDEDDDLFGNDDNPKLKALQDALDKLQQEREAEKAREEEEEAAQEFEQYLDTLENKAKEENLPFHRTFVTALVAQGIDGEQAVAEYHKLLAGQVSTDQPPVNSNTTDNEPPAVMGTAGTAGSGSAQETVDFGAMSRNDVNNTVEQLLAKAAESGQG